MNAGLIASSPAITAIIQIYGRMKSEKYAPPAIPNRNALHFKIQISAHDHTFVFRSPMLHPSVNDIPTQLIIKKEGEGLISLSSVVE
jgi:hypothetical protein